METLQKNILFRLKNEAKDKNIQSKIKQLRGVNNVSQENDQLIIHYDPYSVSEKFLIKWLSELGFEPAAEKKKGFFARWIDKMAKDNKENFGTKSLDCCDMDK